jgi:hypothetical protein
VAETGSVLLSERELVIEALGFLAQHPPRVGSGCASGLPPWVAPGEGV